jgi:hypothetical protein
LGSKRFQYDPTQMWVVIEGGATFSDAKVHTFEDGEAAFEFSSKEDGKQKSAPIPLTRSPLDQASPILLAAGKVMLSALTAYLINPVMNRSKLEDAAHFLQVAIDFARLDPNIEDIFRETRKLLLYQSEHVEEPERTLIDGLRGYLEKLTKV